MKGLKVKPSQYDAYIKSTTHGMEEALKGQFYEYFCYNELLQNNEEIKIVKSNYVERKITGNFTHSKDGKIVYTSRGMNIAEFDVLGIKNDIIYWWEITRSKSIDSKNFKRKMILLNKLFPNYKKVFCVITPYEFEQKLFFNNIIIPEPDYENYFNDGYFKFNKLIKNCISLKEFEKKSTKYDYIDDLITYSHDYFDNRNYEALENLENYILIERLYDIKEIKNLKFRYFEIKSQTSGFIELVGKKIKKDGSSLISHQQKKIQHEIKLLLKRLEYTMQ